MAESGLVPQSSSESIMQKIGLFRVPGLLVKLSAKCLLELDSVRSPTSPLDLKFFTNIGGKSPRSPAFDGNQNQKFLLGERVGLGLVDSLGEESSTILGSRKVLWGSEMRTRSDPGSKSSSIVPVQIDEEVAPQAQGVDQKDEDFLSFCDGMKIDMGPNGFSDGFKSHMSIDEIAKLEDYTCIVSRGPNPRTTHILGDCIFEAPGDQLMQDGDKREEEASSLLCQKSDMLSFCSFCNEKLEEGKDTYIYKGEKAFCSTECRENFIEDEMEDESIIYSVDSCSSSFDDDCLFQIHH